MAFSFVFVRKLGFAAWRSCTEDERPVHAEQPHASTCEPLVAHGGGGRSRLGRRCMAPPALPPVRQQSERGEVSIGFILRWDRFTLLGFFFHLALLLLDLVISLPPSSLSLSLSLPRSDARAAVLSVLPCFQFCNAFSSSAFSSAMLSVLPCFQSCNAVSSAMLSVHEKGNPTDSEGPIVWSSLE